MMNFSFEGNYKSKRSINLGGNKTQVDKKSLLVKAQNERKAREQERLRFKSALKIQSFYKSRKVAQRIHWEQSRLLQQQLAQLISLVSQHFDSVEAADTISTLVVSCSRQILLLCHDPIRAPLYTQWIGQLSQVMLSHVNVASETYSVIELLLLLEDHYDMDTTVWLLLLLARHAILPLLENENDQHLPITYSLLSFVQSLVDPSTYSKIISSDARGIYLRIVTHLLLQDHLFHSLHVLLGTLSTLEEKGTEQTTQSIQAITTILLLCLDNLYPPFDYPPSQIGKLRPTSTTSSTTSSWSPFSFTNSTATAAPLPPSLPLLSRNSLLDLFVTEILSVPSLLDESRDQFVNDFIDRLPFDDILQTILVHYRDNNSYKNYKGGGSGFDTDAVAGLLINLTRMGNRVINKHLQRSLISYSHVLQTLLSDLPPQYLIDTKKKQQQSTRFVSDLESDSDSSDMEDSVMVDARTLTPTTTKYNPAIKSRLIALYASDKLDAFLHKVVNLIFEYAYQHGVTSASSLKIIRSMSNLFMTLITRWPAKKYHILNIPLYYHHYNQQESDGTTKPMSFLHILWQSWTEDMHDISVFNGSNYRIIDHLEEAVHAITASEIPENWSVLYLLCEMYTRLLLTIGDDEFFDRSTGHTQLKLQEMVILSTYLKNIAFVLFWRANLLDVNITIGAAGIQIGQLRHAVTTLLQQLHDRDSRRPFCPQEHWLIEGLDTGDFSSTVVAEEFALDDEDNNNNNNVISSLETASSSSQTGISSAFERRRLQHVRQNMSKARLALVSPRLGLLNNIPFVISFEQRVQIFRSFVDNDRRRKNIFDYVRPYTEVRIRRHHVFEDGFNQLYKLGPALKNKIAILFIDSFGLVESGIDGGGVFKEFLTSLGKEAFDTNYGLFASTPDQLLYPNPSLYATEASQLAFFEFLGLVIGKALYEGILLDVAFAEFFLKKCLGKINYLDDLPSLDPELYKGLIQVKNFEGNVEDLCLDFTLTSKEGDQSRVINLVPNGSNILVTNENRIRYVYLVANYRLNIQIAKQCKAFFSGLSTIVDIKWLRMFNQQELQIMLGGASVPIDIEDLHSHVVYADYQETDPTVQYLWKALYSFSNEERMNFVKFVTSCSRPPVLGFRELQPRLCIRRAGTDETRLPTSSTCVNLLKLPSFKSYNVLRDKLLYAINSDAGFDLS